MLLSGMLDRERDDVFDIPMLTSYLVASDIYRLSPVEQTPDWDRISSEGVEMLTIEINAAETCCRSPTYNTMHQQSI